MSCLGLFSKNQNVINQQKITETQQCHLPCFFKALNESLDKHLPWKWIDVVTNIHRAAKGVDLCIYLVHG